MKRIYTAVYRKYYPSYAWFGRDSGLVTEGLRSVGVESRLVILDTPGIPNDERFLPATRTQFCDPGFWNSLSVDAVVLQGGGEAATQPVADAIKASKAKLVYRMDSDGVIDPIIDPWLFFYGKWWSVGNSLRVRYILWEEMAWAKENAAGRALPPAPVSMNSSLAKEMALLSARLALRPFTVTGLFFLKLGFPKRFGASRIAARLAKADAILVESKIGTARLQRLLYLCGMSNIASKVHTLQIPIPTQDKVARSCNRENIIVIAGRLYDDQKDAKTFVKVIGRFLAMRRDYRAIAIGDGNRYVASLVRRHATDVQDRILVLGRSSVEQIKDWECKAKIFLCTSRGEGFPNAIAEALCRGCSIVAPSIIAAASFAADHSSGTIAKSRRAHDLLDSLVAETNEWASGKRNPEAISSHYTKILCPEEHARQLMNIIKQNE